jgi:hypothetical protein
MKHRHDTQTKEQGFILVLSMFMLTICTMIGMSSMMTSTTEIDIAGNAKVNKETLYQAESNYVASAAAILDKDGYGEWGDDEKFADLGDEGHIKIKDGDFLLEGRADYPASTGKWNRTYQTSVGDGDRAEIDPDVEIRLKDQFNGDADIDKVDVRLIAGSGAEFGSGAEGMGFLSHKVIYNMDCLATLPQRKLRADDGSLNSAIPLSEVVLGYRYVLR